MRFNLTNGRTVAPATYTVTGGSNTPVRKGFTACDTWGHGYIGAVEGESLDAPDQLASGASKGFIDDRSGVLFVSPTYCAR